MKIGTRFIFLFSLLSCFARNYTKTQSDLKDYRIEVVDTSELIYSSGGVPVRYDDLLELVYDVVCEDESVYLAVSLTNISKDVLWLGVDDWQELYDLDTMILFSAPSLSLEQPIVLTPLRSSQNIYLEFSLFKHVNALDFGFFIMNNYSKLRSTILNDGGNLELVDERIVIYHEKIPERGFTFLSLENIILTNVPSITTLKVISY